MKRTEHPRRLAPINIYYHFYSGEYASSLKALKDVYDWVASQETAPLFTSQYLERARGFTTARVVRLSEHEFSIRKYGKCTTLRMDNAGPLRPDLKRSSGVIGYRNTPQGLFIHLVPDGMEARLMLAVAPNNPPYLSHASGEVRTFRSSSTKISFEYTGFIPGQVVIQGVPEDGEYELKAGPSSSMLPAADRAVFIDISSPGNFELLKQ
jgi:hypothetical protein